MRGAALLALAVLPLAGCAGPDAPEPPVMAAFRALYSPLGDGDTGFELELRPATAQADRDLQPRQAYSLVFSNPARPLPEDRERPSTALDAGFRVVRRTYCSSETEVGAAEGRCDIRSLAWPVDDEPAPWGIGWPVAPPDGAERRVEDGRLALVVGETRYEYDDGRLAPSLVTLDDPAADGPWGYRLVAYDVLGPLGAADDWPAPPAPAANATRSDLVHPGEDQDFLGLGWTTGQAIDHLATHPEAGRILDDGGCVLRYGVTDFGPFPPPVPGLPVWPLPLQDVDGSIEVWLQDKEGDSTRWSFYHATDALGSRFSDPEGEPLWPFQGEVSCSDRASAPVPLMDVREAWERSIAHMPDPLERGFRIDLYHMPPSREHGGFSPGNNGFEVFIHVSPRDGEGHSSTMGWDLWRGSAIVLSLQPDDGPMPP